MQNLTCSIQNSFHHKLSVLIIPVILATAIPVATLPHNPQSTNTVTSATAATNAQRITVGNANIRDGLQRLTAQTVTVKQGDSVQRIAMPSFAQLVQTSTGRHIILTSNQQNTNTGIYFDNTVLAIFYGVIRIFVSDD